MAKNETVIVGPEYRIEAKQLLLLLLLYMLARCLYSDIDPSRRRIIIGTITVL